MVISGESKEELLLYFKLEIGNARNVKKFLPYFPGGKRLSAGKKNDNPPGRPARR
jgi:hypothetical protein